MPPKKKTKKKKGVISEDAIEITVPVSDYILDKYLTTKLQLPREHLSPSSITTYQNCAYQFEDQYINGNRGGDSVESMEGTTHHSAFEYNNLYKVKTGKDRPVKKVIEFLCDELHDNWKTVEEKYGHKERDLIIRGKKIQERYHQIFAHRLIPRLVEQEFVIKIGPVKILCYSDVIGELKPAVGGGPAKNVACDYKVSSRSKSDKDVAHSIQLTTYGICDMAERVCDVMSDVGFVTCVKSKMPTIEWQSATMHQGRIDWFVRTVLSVANAISRGAFPPCDPTENGLCSEKWCNAWDKCLGSCKRRKERVEND